MTIRRLKWRRFWLVVCSFLASIIPLGLVVWMHRDEYIATVGQAVKLSIGGIIVAILLLLKIIGKLKMPRRVTAFAMIFILSWLLAVVLQDLMLLSGAALIGEVVDEIFFRRSIKRLDERIHMEKSADVTVQKMEQMMQKYVGGRV
jgi:hypothetical protein